MHVLVNAWQHVVCVCLFRLFALCRWKSSRWRRNSGRCHFCQVCDLGQQYPCGNPCKQRQRFLLSQSIGADTVALSSSMRVLNLSIDTHILSVAQPCTGIDVPMIECFLPFKNNSCYKVFLSLYCRFCIAQKKVLSRTLLKKRNICNRPGTNPNPSSISHLRTKCAVLEERRDWTRRLCLMSSRPDSSTLCW